MLMHGSLDEKKTLCKKSLVRRWWVKAKPYKIYGYLCSSIYPTSFRVYKDVDQRHEINCPDCKKNFPEEKR